MMKLFASWAVIAAIGLAASRANGATVTFDTGELTSFDNIHFAKDLSAATFRTGDIPGTSPLTLVKFSASSENLKGTDGNGVATLEGVDGSLTSLDIAMATENATFTGFDFGIAMNIPTINVAYTKANGKPGTKKETTAPQLQVQAFLDGVLQGAAIFDAKNGIMHYRVMRTDGGRLDEIKITAIGDRTSGDLITMFKQPRMTAEDGYYPAIPVPPAVWSGLALMGVMGVKRFAGRR